VVNCDVDWQKRLIRLEKLVQEHVDLYRNCPFAGRCWTKSKSLLAGEQTLILLGLMHDDWKSKLRLTTLAFVNRAHFLEHGHSTKTKHWLFALSVVKMSDLRIFISYERAISFV